ncbi:MAG TPA: serine hydrolase domain-containing protein [Chthonomonadaceae bacterium]|nr:serine hydrolase domain-containing protein [Chthonomonadaceae bacterium]
MRTTRIAGLLLLVALCSATTARADKIDDYIKAQMASWHIPSVSLAVAREGKALTARAYGFSNVELSAHATPNSVYSIGSITKHFTATAILLLVKEGKLRLEDPITRYLPDLPPACKDITVRHLLNHTSGLIDYTEIPGSIRFARLDRTPEQVVAPALEHPLQFSPGERFAYTNTGYILLGMIVERIAGKPYGQFLKERFFDPLQMTATRLDDKRTVIANRSAGYNWFEGKLYNADYGSPTNKWASGGLISTAEDLIRWDAALASGKILPRTLVEQMMTPGQLTGGERLEYGLGNELARQGAHRVAGHGGETFGFSSMFARYPDDHLVVVVLCNAGDVPSEDFAKHIAGLYLNIPETNDAGVKPIEDREPAVTRLLKGFVLEAAQGRVDDALFSKEAIETLVPLIRRAGPEFIGTLGQLKAFDLVERKEENGLRLYRYRGIFSNKSAVFTFKLNTEGKIVFVEPKLITP